MGFLDTIGQGVPAPRPQNSQPEVAQQLTRDDYAPDAQIAPTKESPRSNQSRAAVIWSGAIIVVAAVAVAAWLGMRNFNTVVAPLTEALADAPPAVPAPAEKPSPKPGSVRAGAAVRSAAKAAAPKASPETGNPPSLPSVGPAGDVANVTQTEAGPIEAASAPIAAAHVAAPAEDDYVYSSEGPAVVAPRLVSLGFVQPLVKGFRTRTSTLELLISKSGTVERAKIFSTSANWEDAMLLSRAKTFQFVPAQRNGVPVRYRLVMQVDATP